MRTLILLLAFSYSCLARAQSYFLFVGTYTNTGNIAPNAPPLDSTGSKGIYVYRFDATTGKATPLSHTRGVCNPSYLAIAPGGRIVYACTESRMKEKGSVSAFGFDPGKGRLVLLGKQSTYGDNPAYVAVDPGDHYVAVANYTGGSMILYPIRQDGSLDKAKEHIQYQGNGPNPSRQEAPHVHSAVFSPEGKYLYIQDLGLDRITGMPLDPEKDSRPGAGEVTISTFPGGGPRHLVFHPNGRFAYLIEEMGGSVDVYRYRPASGGLDSLQRIAAHPDTAKGPFRSSDIHVSPDGRFLYASNRAENTIAIFSIDPETGMLTAAGYEPTMGTEPRNFTLDPSGKWLLVANQESNTLVIFSVDAKTGMIHPNGESVTVPAPTCLKLE
jgi:6-phosphogluconolactonase